MASAQELGGIPQSLGEVIQAIEQSEERLFEKDSLSIKKLLLEIKDRFHTDSDIWQTPTVEFQWEHNSYSMWLGLEGKVKKGCFYLQIKPTDEPNTDPYQIFRASIEDDKLTIYDHDNDDIDNSVDLKKLIGILNFFNDNLPDKSAVKSSQEKI